MHKIVDTKMILIKIEHLYYRTLYQKTVSVKILQSRAHYSNYLYFLICLQGAVNAIDIWSNQDQKYIQYYLNYRFGVYENQRKTADISKEEIFMWVEY